MRASVLIALAGAAALWGGAASAQVDTSVNPVTPAPAAPAAGVSADGQYLSSSALGDTSKLKAGDPGVVSNGPVPDTPENRAAYGQPMSNAGKHTAPKGD